MSSVYPRPIVLDCDPGIGGGMDADDILAILFLVASPEIRLEGVTTVFGNVDVRRATANARRTLAAAGQSHIPVSGGMGVPLSGRLHVRSEQEFADQAIRLGPIVDADEDGIHAVDFILDAARRNPGKLELLAVGPLTNVAMALLKEPTLRSRVHRITIMGGAFAREVTYGRGNITPVAELNMWGDPLAADIVFSSGIPITAVGLDVTNPAKGVVLYEDQLMALVEKPSAFTAFLGEVCRTYIEAPKFHWAKKGCVLYDPLAAATLIDPSLVTTEQASVRVETVGEVTFGQTVATPDAEGKASICVDVDGPAFVKLFTERLQALADHHANT